MAAHLPGDPVLCSLQLLSVPVDLPDHATKDHSINRPTPIVASHHRWASSPGAQKLYPIVGPRPKLKSLFALIRAAYEAVPMTKHCFAVSDEIVPCYGNHFPCSRKEIPCSLSQGILAQVLEISDNSWCLDASACLHRRFFPVNSLINREFERSLVR